MTDLAEILDVDLLARHLMAGNIAMSRHPHEPLRILNYTQRCQFDGAWDTVTRICRGLIVDDDDEVRARPFPKFHNLHEHADGSAAGTIDLVPPLYVFDKLDGSLGIAYRRPSDNAVAWSTRGSFVSDQAEWATAWWREHAEDAFLDPRLTYLTEIIYPENRIVVNYGDRAGLTLLAMIDNATGEQIGPFDSGRLWWPGEVVDVFPMVDDLGAIDRNARLDAEGYVVLSADRLTRVKLKADEYMRLHKLLTRVSNVTIWENLAAGTSMDELIDRVPDEFAAWLKHVTAELQDAHYQLMAETMDEFTASLRCRPPDEIKADREARGEYARSIAGSPNRSLLFALLDSKDIGPMVWKMLKPERATPYTLDADEPIEAP